jgi:NTP pyrophosphatase (non-canonical NTP hydrolase)
VSIEQVLSIEEYQKEAWKTALESAKTPAYMVANLAAEAGEVAGKYAKWIRDGELDPDAMKKELGDVFWQLAGLSTVMGWSLSDIATQNLKKLSERIKNKTIQGSGDNR